MLCIREETISSGNQCRNRGASQSAGRPASAVCMSLQRIKKHADHLSPFHPSNKRSRREKPPLWVTELISIQQDHIQQHPTSSNQQSHQFKCWTPQVSHFAPAHLHLICVKVRKGRALDVYFFRIYLWLGFLRASERMGKDTNCGPFDISISTAGCAAMRCEWKAPLRRAQIRHAIGWLCPGSVLLTQLPRGQLRSAEGPSAGALLHTPCRKLLWGLPSADSIATWSQPMGWCLRSWQETCLIVYLPRRALLVGTNRRSLSASSWAR